MKMRNFWKAILAVVWEYRCEILNYMSELADLTDTAYDDHVIEAIKKVVGCKDKNA